MIGAASEINKGLGRFFNWWSDALASCVPAPVSEALNGGRSRLIIEYFGPSATLHFHHNHTTEILGDIAIGDASTDEQRRAFSGLTQPIKLSNVEIVLQLSPSDVLKKIVTLPSVAAANLYEVLGFEMDRKTPFRVADVYYSGQVVGHNAGEGTLSVDLLVATKPVLNGVLSVLKTWGVAPDRVGVIGARHDSQVDLLAGDTLNGNGRHIDPVAGVLAVVALGLLVAAFSIPLWKRDEALAHTLQQVDRARTEAKVARVMRSQIDELLAGGHYLATRRAEQVSVSQLLHEITRLMPDDSWVNRLRLNDGKVRVTGYSNEASNLIALLEGSDMLTDVKFVSSVTRDSRIGVDRFTLAATVQPRVSND